MNLGPTGLSYYKIIRACTSSHYENTLRLILLSTSICVTLIALRCALRFKTTFCDVYLCMVYLITLRTTQAT